MSKNEFQNSAQLKLNPKKKRKSKLNWLPASKHERRKATLGAKYWSRATKTCGEFTYMGIWICATTVWWDRCRGYVEVKVTGSPYQQLWWNVVWRLQGGFIFYWCLYSFQNDLDLVLKHRWPHAIKTGLHKELTLQKYEFRWKAFEHLGDVILWIMNCVWFSLSKFSPTWKGTLPLH